MLVVPTLDVDLVWHSHQLSPARYHKDCRTNVGRYVDQWVFFLPNVGVSDSSTVLVMIRLSSFICQMRSTRRVEPGRSVSKFIRVCTRLIHAPAEAIWSSLYPMRLPSTREHHWAEARAARSPLRLETLSVGSASATSRPARDPRRITSIRPQHSRSSWFTEKFCGQGSARWQGNSAPRTRSI
jgi:hypothetical protein